MSLSVKTQGGGGGFFPSILVNGLSETDTVYATKDGRTVQGKWGLAPNPAYIGLPTGYTQLEYIGSTGTQYINTGVIGKTGIKAQGKFSLQSLSSSMLLACSASQRFYMLSSNDSQFRYGYVDWVTADYSAELNVDYSFETDFSSQNQSLTVNGTVCASSAISTTITGTYPLYVFACNDRGTAIDLATCRFEYLKLYENDSLVRDYVPCRNQGGDYGFYDLVGEQFYGNSGTGTFTAGAETPQYINGFLISPLREFGTWTVTATDGTNTATQDVLVDVATEFEVEMALSA